MTTYHYRFSVPCEINVYIEGDLDMEDEYDGQEEDAYNRAAEKAEERLQQVAVTINDVSISASIDGVGGDRIDPETGEPQ